jgi:hypothetical protein
MVCKEAASRQPVEDNADRFDPLRLGDHSRRDGPRPMTRRHATVTDPGFETARPTLTGIRLCPAHRARYSQGKVGARLIVSTNCQQGETP